MTSFDANSFGWHDGMLLGYTPMDAEHQKFVQQIDILLQAPAAAIPDALDALATDARLHFADEERWMAETEFPARGCHAAEHAAVMASIDGVRKRVAAGEVDAALRLAKALAEWFPGHADHLDSALAHWMCKLRLGGKPVVIRRHIPASDITVNS